MSEADSMEGDRADDLDHLEDLTSLQLEQAANDPELLCCYEQGRDSIRKVKQWGEAASHNKNVRMVRLHCRCSNPAMIESSLDSAHSDIYNVMETSPTLQQLEVRCYKGLTIVDKLLTRVASRRHNNNNQNSSLLTVKLYDCDFSAESLASLLLCRKVKHLGLFSRTPLVLTTLDCNVLRQALAKSTCLESLELSLNNTRILGASVETPSHLKSLTIDNDKEDELGDDEMVMNAEWKENIIHFFQHTPHLRKVFFKGNQLSGHDLEPFAIGISQRQCTVSDLVLNCKLDDSGCAVLVEMLRKTSSVAELTVRSNLEAIDATLQGLVGNRSIHCASLSSPFVIGMNLQLHRLLTVQYRTLKSLSLPSTLDDACLSALFQALAGNRTITTLSLGKTMLDNDTALEMDRCFQVNTTLTDFHWDVNIRSRSVADIFCHAMKNIKARTYLRVTCRQSVPLFTDLIVSCESLVELSTMNHSKDVSSYIALLQALERNRTLESLFVPSISYQNPRGPYRVSFNDICIMGDHLIKSLPRIMGLKRLCFWNDDYWVQSWKSEILQALSCNCSLEEIKLYSSWSNQEFQQCVDRNKKRREFVVGITTTREAAIGTLGGVLAADSTTAVPAGLLAKVLATVVHQPCSAPARYDVLRRNVHALVARTPSSGTVMERKRKHDTTSMGRTS